MIVLNGGSSSGKTGITRCLQAVLPDPWLAFGVDTLIAAMPASMHATDAGIEFAPDGGVSVGPEFRALEGAWIEGIVAMAARAPGSSWTRSSSAGARPSSAGGTRSAVCRWLWGGVRCDGAVAAGRETARGDRVAGMAASQADLVHRGVVYDLEVDTTRTESIECARTIAAHIA